MRKRSSTMISCFPCASHHIGDVSQEPALQALLASKHMWLHHKLSRVVLNPPTIKHDVRTLHAGEYSASMQGQANPHPHSIVMVPSKSGRFATAPTVRPPGRFN